MASANMRISLRPGPAVQGIFELMKIIEDVLDLVPDWHSEEREALIEKVREIRQMFPAALKIESDR